MTHLDRRSFLKTAAGGLAAAGTVAVLGSSTAEAAVARPAKRKWDGFELVVIRHGESEVNVRPIPGVADEGVTYPLTLLGMEQVEALTKSLRHLDVQAVATSTRLRCIQTANPLAFDHDRQLELAPEVVEISFAGATSSAEVGQIFGQWIAGNLNAKTAGGESLLEAQARALPGFQRLIDAYEDTPGALIVVCHGAIMMGVLPALFSNVSLSYGLTHAPANTGIIRGEFVDGELVCTDWLGSVPA